eukprot:symbB.v1.2.003452.t1/scaffold194.1/size275082/13
MNQKLSALVKDPNTLKKSVKMRRMELEDIKAYHAVSKLNGIEEKDSVKVSACQEKKQVPTQGVHML